MRDNAETMEQPETLPELLAPAGSLECLHAAVSAGADAVYLGLDQFNARRNADNFTLDNLPAACDYAHLRGVAVYITMNVEILPDELDRAIDYARRAYEAGADALIVQDIGLAHALRERFPHIELHASTQMNIHSAAGIVAAAQLGMARVTLARELHVAEIAELVELAREFDMTVECFAHGALCICYSGQCLMSSMIGGRSANRGLCAQACRLPYDLHRADREGALPADGEHLLSPRDLCTIDLLADLAHAGVASLKIEGRMKSPDYVHEVVSVYREALDALQADAVRRGPAANSDDMHVAWRGRLEEAFSRGFTTAYLEGERGNAMMSYGRPNNRGVFVGRVEGVVEDKRAAREGAAFPWVANVAHEAALHEGDVVEFWTNKGHFTATVPRGSDGARGRVRIPIERRVGKGDRVFRVRNAQTAFEDDPLQPKIGVTAHAELVVGQPAHLIAWNAAGQVGEAWGPVVEAARTRAISEDDVRAHIDRLGQTPFTLDELTVNLSDNVGMGFSQLHHLRAEALDELEQAMLAPWHARGSAPMMDYAPGKGDRRRNRNASSSVRKPLVMAWVTNPDCARAARRAGADGMYVPLLNFRRGQAQTAGVLQDTVTQAGYPKQCIMALPTVDHDPLSETREGRLSFDPWDYVREGRAVFADSMAATLRALELGADVEVGPHVPVTNRASLDYLAALGVKRVWLSPELTLGQVAELAEHVALLNGNAETCGFELGLFVSGAQELMICEHCLLMSQGPCNEQCETCPRRAVAHRLVDRKGFEFPVVTDLMGRSHLYNGIELDAVATLPDLVDLGIAAVMVDTTLLDRKAAEGAVSRAVKAAALAADSRQAVPKRSGTTTGHLFRGVQ